MNQVAEQQTEFEEETVAEAIESAKAETEQEDDGFEIEVVDDTPEESKVNLAVPKTLNRKFQAMMTLRNTVKVFRNVSNS